MNSKAPVWMSVNAGYVDTAGFLALHGLFTAHVTGNFVTLGASLVLGSSGAIAKLLALPVFCVVIIVMRLFANSLPKVGFPILRTMLFVQFVLLGVGALMAVHTGSAAQGDDLASILTGMVLVSAMAIQNAASRTRLGSSPPTTLMTGTTTQIMIDIADLIRGLPPEARAAATSRMSKMFANVAGFALGCAGGAILYSQISMWCFAIPPILVAIQIVMISRDDQF